MAESESLERLIRKRAGLRSSTTKLLNKLEQELGKTEVDVNIVEELMSQLSTKEIGLTGYDLEVQKVTENLDDLEKEISSAQDYLDFITVWKTRARRVTQKNDNERNDNQRRESSQRQTVKLPKLNLETFHGEINCWQGFWTQYETAIHKNDSITKAEKFSYLKSYLGGKAASAVAGLAISDANYDVAISLLTERFGRKDLVINSYMSNLLSLTPVKRSSEVKALRELYDNCEIQVQGLKSMGVSSSTYGNLLCPVLLRIIPEDISLEFSRRRDNDAEWDVTELLKYIRKEVESRERTSMLTKNYLIEKKTEQSRPSSDSFNSKHGQKYNQKGKIYNMPSTSALNTSAQQGPKCPFCTKLDHSAEKCDAFSIEEKREIVKRDGRCFICLKPNHQVKYCKFRANSCRKCKGKHHASICKNEIDTKTGNSNYETRKDNTDDTLVSHVTRNSGTKSIMLQTMLVNATGGGTNDKVIRCLLDGGSQRSFVKESLSRELNLEVTGKEKLHLFTFGNTSPLIITRNRVKITLRNISNPNISLELEALEMPNISSATINVPDENVREILENKGITLTEGSNHTQKDGEISVLIGSDFYWKIVTGRVQRLQDSLVAVESLLGWTLQGPSPVSSFSANVNSVSTNKVIVENNESLSKQLRSFWELEAIGITDPPSQCEDQTMLLVQSSINYKNGRYEIGLPWKEQHPDLPSNFELAKSRLKNLHNKFKGDAVFYDRYNAEIQEQLNEGIIETVTDQKEISHVGTKVKLHYVPHRAVLKENRETSKLRIVFDASAHTQGAPSLNDCLLTGPNLNPDLLRLLLKFRVHAIAFMADIKKAFLQISLSDSDRDAVRFLWFEEFSPKFEDSNIVIYRMTRVLFGASPSPFLLAATVRHHLDKFKDAYPETCEMLDEDLYVDDLISGKDSLPEAYKATDESRQILQKASMSLRKWRTNSKYLAEMWQEQNFEQIENDNDRFNDNKVPLKVLGLKWDTNSDLLKFDLSNLQEVVLQPGNTKRSVLQAVSRIFDPIGFLSPYVVRAKCLFQALWECGLDWDDKLPEALRFKWECWCAELRSLEELEIKRHYFNEVPKLELKFVELHLFSDASEKAYGAVAYLRYQRKGEKIGVTFVSSKCRVSPLKKLTIPRLELMGALAAARLQKQICKALDVSSDYVYFWSDSTIILQWIRGSADKWKQFVSNRVTEIQGLTDPQRWNHCAGSENPADMLTRGCSVSELKQTHLWWEGPSWLRLGKKEWPRSEKNDVPDVYEGQKEELKLNKIRVNQLTCNSDVKIEGLLDLKDYSSFKRMIRVTAWVMRFCKNSKESLNKIAGDLNADELDNAELYWIKNAQLEFQHEIQELKTQGTLPDDSKLCELSPILTTKGILCVGGRLQCSILNFHEKHPVILPAKHKFTELLIIETHEKLFHAGVRDVLAQIRERYFIPKGRQIIKSVLNKCLICKKCRAKAGLQRMAPLPSNRITEAPPFEITGVDFAGPLYPRNGQPSPKCYITLFTCAVTRAVHLELVSNLSTENFILALKRFVSRRGICKTIYSDNAQTFKRANSDLNELWNVMKDPQLKQYYGDIRIRWIYIVSRGAWWGGFYERMVRTVKNCLKRKLGSACLNYEELETILTEVEAAINSRPLTYSYDNSQEPSPLTPAHFLIGNRLTSLPPLQRKLSKVLDANRKDLTKRWKYRQRILENFWIRWKNEYLLDLRSNLYNKQTKEQADFKIGDVVLINDERLPRHMWKMGRVSETFIGRDKRVRSVAVKLGSGKTLKRPVQLLCPLELS